MTRYRADPTTISGVTSGTSAIPFATLLERERHRVSPMASITPSGVATRTVATPRMRLFFSDRRRLGSSKTDPSLQQYHWRENPCQVLRDRPSLNENWTAISTGSSDHRMYSQVTVARTYGRRHGFRHGGTHFRRGWGRSAARARGVSTSVIGRPWRRVGSGPGS